MATFITRSYTQTNLVQINPAFAWLFVFLPALTYFISTRLSFGSEVGVATTDTLLLRLGTINETQTACIELGKVLYIKSSSLALCKYSPPEEKEEETNAETITTTDDSSSQQPPATPTSVELQYPLQLVQETGLRDVVEILWRHDSDIGRGYLLLSESSSTGRIWRWEVGGGPITIGKTLHLDDSGCRSGQYYNCSSRRHHPTTSSSSNDENASSSTTTTGSGAMTIDFYRHGNPSSSQSSSEGLLVIAEWGEGRIVRLEENGARTPLMMHLPPSLPPCNDENNHVCHAHSAVKPDDAEEYCSQQRRLPNIQHMTFTPNGELVLAVNYESPTKCNNNKSKNDGPDVDESENARSIATAALIQLPFAGHVKALASLHESRQAHLWQRVVHNHTSSRVLYHDPWITKMGGIAGSPSMSIYATATRRQEEEDSDETLSSIVLIEVAQDEDEDDDDESPYPAVQGTVLFNLAEYTPGLQDPGALAVSKSGRIFIAIQDGILILDRIFGVLGKVTVPAMPVGIAIADDGYVYIATSTQLFRIRSKEKPLNLPTNQVVSPPKAKVA